MIPYLSEPGKTWNIFLSGNSFTCYQRHANLTAKWRRKRQARSCVNTLIRRGPMITRFLFEGQLGRISFDYLGPPWAFIRVCVILIVILTLLL